jgi:hypothetical protein
MMVGGQNPNANQRAPPELLSDEEEEVESIDRK